MSNSRGPSLAALDKKLWARTLKINTQKIVVAILRRDISSLPTLMYEVGQN